jgi:iron complex outermembrane receptor protein
MNRSVSRKTHRKAPLVVAIASALSLLTCGVVMAQDNPASPAADQPVTVDPSTPQKSKADNASSTAANQLDTIQVTATRRSEPLQKVPMAVSAVTHYDIQRQHLQSFSDYAASVPGLNAVTAGPGRTELSIRGIASGSGQAVSSVGTYVDDTPYGSSSAYAVGASLTPDIDPADLERIEVLRGPQGTLYGAGALGGVVRFITTPPDSQDLYGRLQIGGSSISGGGTGFDVHGMVNVPLVKDKLALRANVYDTTTPGFIDDAGLGKRDVNETKSRGGRASLLWTPTDKTSLQLTVLSHNLNSAGNPSVALDPITLKPLYGDLQQRNAALGGNAVDARYRLYNLTFKSDFGWSKFTSSTSYGTLDATINLDATSLLNLTSFTAPNGHPLSTLEQEPVHQSKVTQEFRLSSPDDQAVTWLGGLFFTHEIGNVIQNIPTADYYTGQVVASPLGNPIEGTIQPSSYLAYAAYGSVTWHVSDRFDVEAGLRYSHDKQHYTEFLFGSPALGLPPAPTVQVDNYSSDSSTTYSFTPQFHINANNLLYARVASGFLPGGPNVVVVGTPNVPPTFSPTELTDYEVGLKSTLMDGHLLVDLSAYHINWTKIPLLTYANGFTFLESGGQAKSNGVEASIAFIPVRGLKLSANTAYNKATLTKDAPFPSNGKSGDPLPYAPKFTMSLNGDYDFALGAGWRGYVGATYQHIGRRSTDYAFSYPVAGGPPPLPSSPTVPGYNTLNLRAGVRYDVWNIDLYAKNVTNERGIVQASSFQNYVPVPGQVNPITGQTEDNATIITPRQIGISFSRTF